MERRRRASQQPTLHSEGPSSTGHAFDQEMGVSNSFLLAHLQNRQSEIPEQYASRSEVWKTGYRDGMSQGESGLANINGDPLTQAALANASDQTGVSQDNLSAMSIIESNGNRNVGTNAFGYTGLMQMGRDAATDVGMNFNDMIGGDNVENNALAGAKYWNLNDQRLNEDIPRDPLHMYLAHQQGAGGTNKLMNTLETNPTAPANRNQRNNVPGDVIGANDGNLTQRDFYDYWSGKMTAIQDAIAASKNRQA